MNRSRALLLAAWGVLIVGSAVQVVRPDGDPAPVTIGSEQLPVAAEDPGQAGAEPTEQLAYRIDGDDSGPVDDRALDRTATGGPITLDDPARWAAAGAILSTRSLVATVRGDGVASLALPEPGPVEHWFPNPTQFGGQRTFLVVDDSTSASYVKVSLPVMPNGQEGWIPRSAVDIAPVTHRAVVDLSDHSVTVWDGDRVIADTRAATGKRATPTPMGLFYVRDIIAQPGPDGPYGSHILALSGFSEVLDSFNGALPALAIHGTDDPTQLGAELSSGCVRIPNEVVAILAEQVPLGTPVAIVA